MKIEKMTATIHYLKNAMDMLCILLEGRSNLCFVPLLKGSFNLSLAAGDFRLSSADRFKCMLVMIGVLRVETAHGCAAAREERLRWLVK